MTCATAEGKYKGMVIFYQFLRWWLAELSVLVPEAVRTTLTRKGEVVVVDVSGPEITITRSRGNGHQKIAQLPQPSRALGEKEWSGPDLSRRLKTIRGDIVLRMPAKAALRKAVTLPLAAEVNLREILYFELDRQTPFRPDEIYFDYRILKRSPDAQRIMVELIVLARALVDPIRAWLVGAGLDPARAEGIEPGGERWTCRLPVRGADAIGRPPLTRFLNLSLIVLILALAGTAAYVAATRQEAVLIDLQAKLAVEQRKAEDTLRLRKTLAALGEEVLHLANKKQENASVLEIWNEVTRIMPDHSFILELRLRERQVELVGQSAAATGLLDVIESSPLFRRATFRSPITRGHGSDAERFHLAFEVGPRKPEQSAER